MARRGFKEYLTRNYRYFIIGGLFVVLVVILIVIWSRSSHNDNKDEDNASTIPELETTVEVPKDKYEENAYLVRYFCKFLQIFANMHFICNKYSVLALKVAVSKRRAFLDDNRYQS